MIHALVFYGYLLGLPFGFVVGCRFGYAIVTSDVTTPDRFDTAMGAILGTVVGAFAAIVWPVCAVVYVARGFLFESRSTRRARELDERERRIKELEREAGISRE